jgi:triosephosphate isomerase
MSIRPLVAGNWKMNGLVASIAEFDAIAAGLAPSVAARVDVAICPPFTLVAALAARRRLAVGGQDCHTAVSGAHTGDVSAEMLKDAGATYVIVGHSERRTDHGESDALVAAKAAAARRAGLVAIVCVGETRDQRESGQTLEVVRRQIAGSLDDGLTAADTVIAYEPVWAIGTGLTPTAADVAEVHADIRARLSERFGAEGTAMRILYGGSVKGSNAAELMTVANVDGALVGGASLKAADFLAILAAYA